MKSVEEKIEENVGKLEELIKEVNILEDKGVPTATIKEFKFDTYEWNHCGVKDRKEAELETFKECLRLIRERV